jgi:site-specific DNA recombinase
LQQTPLIERQSGISDRDVIDRCVERVVVHPNSIEIGLRKSGADEATEGDKSVATFHMPDGGEQPDTAPAAVITVPWDAPRSASVKGILHQPSGKRLLKPGARDTILLAIAKARSWIDDFASGRVQSFAEIAHREGKVERHIRLLAPLAFTPPALLAAIITGSAPNDLTVTTLAQTMPYARECEI